MTRISPRTRIDIAIAVSVFAWAFWWGSTQVDPLKGLFYQQHFAPAVMRALGYGFVNPASTADIPGLADFLSRKRADVAAVPHIEQLRTKPFDYFQPAHRYLLETAALCWRMLGISWSSLWPLCGMFLAVLAVGSYVLSRALLSPVLATVTTVIFCAHAPVIKWLSHLRDFSKAPFILLALALLVHMAVRRGSRKALLLQSVAIGSVIGLGWGFRADVFIMVPMAAVLLLGFARSMRGISVSMSALSVLVIVGTAALVSSPILLAYMGFSNGWHWIVLGLMTRFNENLGVLAAETHEVGWIYYDNYAAEIINDYARRCLGANPVVNQMSTAQYDSWGGSYYREVLALFPADLAVRALGALTKAYSSWPRPSMPLLGYVPILLTTAFLFAARLRWGLMFLAIVGYFGALVSLQYHERHAFYLALAPIIAAGFLLQVVLNTIFRHTRWRGIPQLLLLNSRGSAPARFIRRGWGGRLVALACIALIVPASLAAVRTYQSGNVYALLERLESLPPVDCTFDMSFEDGAVVLSPPRRDPDSPFPPVGSRLWLLELALPEGGNIEVASSPISLFQDCTKAQRSDSRQLVFARRHAVPGSTFLRYVFFTLNTGCPELRLKLDADFAPMVKRFCELDSADAGPVLVNALLPVPGVELVPYQRLSISGSP